jgi:hypothetical protein
LLLDMILEGRFDFAGAFVVCPPLGALLKAQVDDSVPFIHRWTVQEFLPRVTDDGNTFGLRLANPRMHRMFWGLRRLLDAGTSDAIFEWLRDDRHVNFWGPNDFWKDFTEECFDLHLGFKAYGGIEVPEPGLQERLYHLVAWLDCLCAFGAKWLLPQRMSLLPPIQDLDEIEREVARVVEEEVDRARAKMSWWARTFGGTSSPIEEDARARFKELRDRVLEQLLVLSGGITVFTSDQQR